MGNSTGRVEALDSYNYEYLKDWFFVQHLLNQRSDVTPMLAAYYFGAVKDKKKISTVLDYLEVVGSSSEGEKWRWLGHAVHLAHYNLEDLDRALKLSHLLSHNKSPGLADWARQMPAFILESNGQNDLAYEIMLGILQSRADKLHPNEVNFMIDYMCNRLLKNIGLSEKPDFCSQ